MPFLLPTLARNIADAFLSNFGIDEPEPGSPPNTNSRVVRSMASAYDSYVSEALASSPLRAVVPPQSSALLGPLSAPMFSGWAVAFVSYWSPVTFFGPGLIPVNPVDPGSVSAAASVISAGMAQLMSAPSHPRTREEAAQNVASVLHSATSSLLVITTTLPPATVILPVPIP